MIKTSLLIPAALALVPSLMGISAAANTKTGNTDIRSAIIEKYDEKLSESAYNAEQSKYDEISAAIESGIKGRRVNFDGLTDEQKAEFAEKRAEFAPNGKFGSHGGSKELTDEQKAKIVETLTEKLEAGVITQEKYDEIIAAIESGDFSGAVGGRFNFGELTDEQKAEFAENGKFGKHFGSRGNFEEPTDEQKAERSAKIVEGLAEKLEAGEITQEKYDESIAAIESGDFSGAVGGHFNFKGLTDEQKTELSENGKPGFGKDMRGNAKSNKS